MTIYCPHCSTGYLLPDELLGPGGARVRCPTCSHAFVVHREEPSPAPERPAPVAVSGVPAPVPTPGRSAPALAAPAAAPEPDPGAVAAEVLDRLAAHLGSALEQARAEACVLSRFGPDVMRAYEEYRERLGDRATAHAFRVALRERWAVDLIPVR